MKDHFNIKDECRAGLCKYLIKALSYISLPDSAKILDMGCGTGVPAITLAKHTKGFIYALDSDRNALNVLAEKVTHLQLRSRFRIMQSSIPETSLPAKSFDLVLAEGILNITGFFVGIEYISRVIRPGGYVIIHDEWKDHAMKCSTFSEKDFRLIHTFQLRKEIWFNEYVQCLENSIQNQPTGLPDNLFQKERNEIELYYSNPECFASVYYILQKETDNRSH
jgi:ubiquinone/menaquinone biosynthesis C-methylase UbiE